jgi:FtsZ-binding cell division protein ZapB
MISLEQIRLLEGKITRAIELIRVLKDENATLRRGLDSAQKRMKELESLVDGFKADQKEIESVIVRTLRHLEDLEDGSGAAGRGPAHAPFPRATAPQTGPAVAAPVAPAAPPTEKPPEPEKPAGAPLEGTEKRAGAPPEGIERGAGAPTKDELDIF